jgi:hypothetical protein
MHIHSIHLRGRKEINVISILVNNLFNVRTLDDKIARVDKREYKKTWNEKTPHKNRLH